MVSHVKLSWCLPNSVALAAKVMLLLCSSCTRFFWGMLGMDMFECFPHSGVWLAMCQSQPLGLLPVEALLCVGLWDVVPPSRSFSTHLDGTSTAELKMLGAVLSQLLHMSHICRAASLGGLRACRRRSWCPRLPQRLECVCRCRARSLDCTRLIMEVKISVD